MDRFYDFFIARFKGLGEDYSRARLIVNFFLTEIFVSIVYALAHGQFNFHVPQWLFILFSLSLVLILIIFRALLSLVTMAHILIASMWLSFVIGIALSGGIYSLVLPWLATMPIMANLLISRRAAKWWAIVSLISVASFMFFYKNPQVVLDHQGDWRALTSALGLVFTIFFFSDLFSASKTKLLSDLKVSNNELVEQKEEVIAQNEELLQQRNEIGAQRDHIEKQNLMLRQQNVLVEKINEELAKKAKEIFDRNVTVEKHWHTLIAMSKSKSINFGDFDEALKYIVKTAATSLNTNRVSVWQYEPDRKSIKCLVLYELVEDRFSQQEELLAKDFPRYFEALRDEEVIPADDAETDSHTFEFKESYLKPYHIQSMMDTPYFLDGKLAGVLCCEHLTHRHWLPEDIIFAQALSDIVTLVFRAVHRREYESKIRANRKEIARANQTLEDRIKERTAELEDQNRQLAEYAFINSHLLRAPLCRLLGLINLIDHTSIHTKEKELIDHLKLSGEELDDVVKKINSAIEKGSHFDRNEI